MRHEQLRKLDAGSGAIQIVKLGNEAGYHVASAGGIPCQPGFRCRPWAFPGDVSHLIGGRGITPGISIAAFPNLAASNSLKHDILSSYVAAPRNFWRTPIDKRSAKQFIRINERIRAREVRVIDDAGNQLGILPPFEALKIARERGLDLVEVSPNAVPPVCRIQDYGKFLYEKDKSERAARKKQKIIVIKEVKFSVTVDEHDYQTKKNQAVRFLTEGDKVKASLRFKGRQMAHRELGYAIINRLIQDIGDAGTVEFMPRMEGTTLHAILAPGKKEQQAAKKPAAPKAPAPPPVAQSQTVQ
jgi:translation initiation factor IF-3